MNQPIFIHEPCLPAMEAMKSLCALRMQIFEQRSKLMENPLWKRYDEHWLILSNELAFFDSKIAALLSPRIVRTYAAVPEAGAPDFEIHQHPNS